MSDKTAAPAAPAREIDLRSLRAMAHPLRMRILNILWTEGPATSTTLARRLGESTGTLSWHLRHLAAHDLIEEDVDRGTRRERWWKAPEGEIELRSPELFEDPAARTPLSDVLQHASAHHFGLVSRFWAEVHAGAVTREWVDAATMSSSGGTEMSPRQLGELNRELREVVKRHCHAAEREPEPGSEPVVVLLYAFPIPPDGRTTPEPPPEAG